MRIEEVRDLDGPNLFLAQPAVKVEIAEVPEESAAAIMLQLAECVERLHEATGQGIPPIVSTEMDRAGHIAVAFGWQRRAYARSLGTWAAQLVIGERDDEDAVVIDLNAILDQPADSDDAPLVVKTANAGIPVIAITGTNGKTTTSRLIAYVLRHLGHKVGLTSSTGVYVNGEPVIRGDYSGPSGARRVFAEPGVEYAVLETARGGMLLRGCGYDASDVAVITNVTEDHMGLHGITTIEGLARVKAIIARSVKPGGFCVLNADDSFTLAMTEQTSGVPVLFTRKINNPDVASHCAAGGKAITLAENGDFVWHDGSETTVVTNVVDIPMTFNGRATHQVENALGATAALIGLGISFDDIKSGLAAFKSSAEESLGRLNLFEINGATVIIDFAHNEAGLVHLLNFGRSFVKDDGQLVTIVGTAGDRDDDAVAAIAKTGVEMADKVVLKDSHKFLRGRNPGEMMVPLRAGAAAANRPEVEVVEYPDELVATLTEVEALKSGDVLAVMAQEDYEELIAKLTERGKVLV
ncbi:MAG: hypothetical protein KC435_01515 [Thermomicrobiales bacterium]|nr:hypothetical protein [Thermomicrobiales bacterium]